MYSTPDPCSGPGPLAAHSESGKPRRLSPNSSQPDSAASPWPETQLTAAAANLNGPDSAAVARAAAAARGGSADDYKRFRRPTAAIIVVRARFPGPAAFRVPLTDPLQRVWLN